MSRIIVFLTIYLVLLGTCSFRAEFKDGLKITLIGWPEYLQDRYRAIKQKAPE